MPKNYKPLEHQYDIGDELTNAWNNQDIGKLYLFAKEYHIKSLAQKLNKKDPTYPWMFIFSTIPVNLVSKNPSFIGKALAHLQDDVFQTNPQKNIYILPAVVSFYVLQNTMDLYQDNEFVQYSHKPDEAYKTDIVGNLLAYMMQEFKEVFSKYSCSDYGNRLNIYYENENFADNKFDEYLLTLQVEHNLFLKQTLYGFKDEKEFPKGLEQAIFSKLLDPFSEAVFIDGLNKKYKAVKDVLNGHVKKCAVENPTLFLKSKIAEKMITHLETLNQLKDPSKRELYFNSQEHVKIIEYIENMQSLASISVLREVQQKIENKSNKNSNSIKI